MILSILIGSTIALFPLFLSEKIYDIEILENNQNLLILTLLKFTALPSLAINIGILPKRIHRLKENFTWKKKERE